MSRIKLGGPVDKIKVGLRVSGDSLDPNEVTRMLACEPTRANRKGETPSGKNYRTVTGGWLLESKLPPTDELEVQLENLLASVTDDLSVWKELTTKYKVDMFCGLFLEAINRGFELSSKMMKALSERNISIGFDIYT
jgi:hypothetical protein